MNLLNPAGLIWASVAIPIVVLFVLRIRRRRQTVPTLMFWEQIFEEATPRSLWRRLRHWVSLLLQLLLVALLALALADPIATSASTRPTRWLVIVDQSASMQTRAEKGSRFDQARALTHDLVRGMRLRDQATIIAAGPVPLIACGRTYHQPTLHDAINRLDVTDAPCDLAAAVELARAIDVGSHDRRVTVITDAGGAIRLGGTVSDDVSVLACGLPRDNTGITGFAVRARADNPFELQGMLRVARYGSTPATAEIRILLDDELFDVVVMDLSPGEETIRSFSYVHAGGRLLRAKLTAADALMADNEAVAVLPPVRRKRVLLVSGGDLFLESVLEAQLWSDVSVIQPSDWSGETTADLVVFDQYVPNTIPPVPTLFVYPARDSALWTVGPTLVAPLVSDLDEDNDLLRHVNLRNCTFGRAQQIVAKQPAEALAASFEHPLVMYWSRDYSDVLMFAMDIHQSDLPWRTAFPILMQNALNILGGAAAAPVSAYPTGRTIDLATTGRDVAATNQRGRDVPVVRHEDRLIVGPVNTVGVATVWVDGRPTDLAFNLADGDESNVATAMENQGDAARRLAAVGSVWAWPWWVVLVIVAIGLSATEWCLHQRRVIE